MARVWPPRGRGARLALLLVFVSESTTPRLTCVLRAGATAPPAAPKSMALAPAPPTVGVEPEPPVRGESRRRRLRQEFGVRVTVTALLLLFNELLVADHAMSSIIRLTAFTGLVLNVPYYLTIRTGVALRAQAYTRMLFDVALTTAGLYGAGGLGAPQYP